MIIIVCFRQKYTQYDITMEWQEIKDIVTLEKQGKLQKSYKRRKH